MKDSAGAFLSRYPSEVSTYGEDRNLSESSLVDLEARIKQLPGVLGCVILANPDGRPSEIQAFSRAGHESDVLEGLIQSEVEKFGAQESVKHIHVFELEAESFFGSPSRRPPMLPSSRLVTGPPPQPSPSPDPSCTNCRLMRPCRAASSAVRSSTG
jgi:hypothetical protein